MKGSALAVLALALASCGEGEPVSAPTPVEAPAPPPDPWRMEVSGAGTAIVLHEDQTGPRLRIACRRNPADLYVELPHVERIGSEERLTLGAGDELATLVAVPGTPEGAPVSAAGPAPPGFLDALEAGQPIGAAYGATYVRDLPPVPETTRRAFAEACRQAVGGAPSSSA